VSEAVARYWVHRCRRGDPAQPGSPCAAILWLDDEITRLRDELTNREIVTRSVRAELGQLRAMQQRARFAIVSPESTAEERATAQAILGVWPS
jgi:hypothetical protein